MGTVRVSRAFLPLMRSSRDSRLIIVTSMASRFSLPAMVPYSMSKHAVRAFADGLRKELSNTSIRVSAIEPSMYLTNLTEATSNLENLDANWLSTPEAVRESLGQGEFARMREHVYGYLSTLRKNTGEVVDVITAAILTKEPRAYYRVCGLNDHLFFWFVELLPDHLQDLFLDSTILSRFNKLLSMKRK